MLFYVPRKCTDESDLLLLYNRITSKRFARFSTKIYFFYLMGKVFIFCCIMLHVVEFRIALYIQLVHFVFVWALFQTLFFQRFMLNYETTHYNSCMNKENESNTVCYEPARGRFQVFVKLSLIDKKKESQLTVVLSTTEGSVAGETRMLSSKQNSYSRRTSKWYVTSAVFVDSSIQIKVL